MMGFLTGSRIYGVSRPESDLDMVLKVTPLEAKLLTEVQDSGRNDDYGSYGNSPESTSIRFGRLNLIICFTDEAYHRWLAARSLCRMKSPITRDEAVRIHKEHGI